MATQECDIAIEEICEPLHTLEDVFNWEPKRIKFCTELLAERVHVIRSPKTLVCHDMKGGYLEDRFVHGVKKKDCFNFIHWSVVDIFVYFSHHLVTIPPCGWVTAAHRNGTLILGTFITEWDQGMATCEKFLVDKNSVKRLCDQLVCIALFYGFDGWLINIENKIKPNQVKLLNDFVTILTNSMHKVKAGSLVIWYDSVIESGELKWQNALNEENRNFFHSCDGIFLNYNWTDELLKKSVNEAGPRLEDVFVGIDIFGRGCPGGGGFDSHIAAQMARDHNLSIAIFAPGWVYETLGKDNFLDNQYQFWNLLSEYCPARCIKSLPFSTSFCPGFGKKMYRGGVVIDNQPWYNLSLQQPQATFHYLDGAPFNGSSMIYTNDAYVGGGCLKLTAPQAEDGAPRIFGIFSTYFALTQFCLITYTFKPISNFADMIVTLDMTSFDESYCLLLMGKDLKEQRAEQIYDCDMLEVKPLIIYPATEEDLKTVSVDDILINMHKTDRSWITRTYILEASEFKSYVVHGIGAKLLYPCSEDGEHPSVLLGQIKILPVEHNICFSCKDVVKSLEGNIVRLKCTLVWNYNPSVYCWDLHYKFNDHKSYMCSTTQPFFNVDLYLELQQDVSLMYVEFILRPQSVLNKFYCMQSLVVNI